MKSCPTTGTDPGRLTDHKKRWSVPLAALLLLAAALHAETGYNAWLRYSAITGPALDQYRQSFPPVVATLADSTLESSARSEIIRGIRGMLGRTPRAESGIPQESAIILGTLEQIHRAAPQWRLETTLAPGGYWLKTVTAGPTHYTVIAASDERGVLYGAFALLRKVASANPSPPSTRSNPPTPPPVG